MQLFVQHQAAHPGLAACSKRNDPAGIYLVKKGLIMRNHYNCSFVLIDGSGKYSGIIAHGIQQPPAMFYIVCHNGQL